MKEAKIRSGSGFHTVGQNSKTLVAALTGTSTAKRHKAQLEKVSAIANLSPDQKPHIISDLSLIKFDTNPIYKFTIDNFPEFSVSTLPIYLCSSANGRINEHELLDTIAQQAEEGVSMFTIHPTPNKLIVTKARKRMTPCTSRGGGIVIRDLIARGFEYDNVYLRIIDPLIKIALKHSIVISIGASFRSANIFDSLDEAQIEEFRFQKKIADYIFNKGVDVIIEGPGHANPKKIKDIARLFLEMGYPIMPLGPIPTDIAIGQDHISSAIGVVLLGIHNCVHIISAVTREEHTGGVPSIQSTIEAIIASKIAAHIIDINKLGDSSKDFEIASHRSKFETCVYGKNNGGCSRCLDVCPLEIKSISNTQIF